MTASSGGRLYPATESSITTERTDDGVVVLMTTEPRQVSRPEGFSRTATVTRWRRGPMHPDDASVLVRVATAHGTDPAKWTPIPTETEQVGAKAATVGPDAGADGAQSAQGDFGDLF